MTETAISEAVQDYYGKVLQSSQDLKTSACCTLRCYARFFAALSG